jgi:hypothetical protein
MCVWQMVVPSEMMSEILLFIIPFYGVIQRRFWPLPVVVVDNKLKV